MIRLTRAGTDVSRLKSSHKQFKKQQNVHLISVQIEQWGGFMSLLLIMTMPIGNWKAALNRFITEFYTI